MNPARHAAFTFFDQVLRKGLRSDPLLAVDPFFWPTIRPYHQGESSSILLSILSGKSHPEFFEPIHLIFVNFLRLLRRVRVFKKENSVQSILLGKLNPETEVLFYAWLFERDFDRFIETRETYAWNQIPSRMAGKNIQFLVYPLFRLTDRQQALLLSVGAIVANSHYKLPLLEVVYAICASTFHSLKALFLIRRLDWAVMYAASFLNPRFWTARAYFRAISNMPIGRIRRVLIPWESQPEQRAICGAFQARGVRVEGYIHSSVTCNPFFLARFGGEKADIFFPARLYIHGRAIRSALEELGWKKDQICEVRSIRFARKAKEDFQGKIFFPYDVWTSGRAVPDIIALISAGKIRSSTVLHHPANRQNRRLVRKTDNIKCNADGTDVVVVGFSTVILEALEAGCSVVTVLPNGIGKLDPGAYATIRSVQIGENSFRLELIPDGGSSLIDFREDSPELERFLLDESDFLGPKKAGHIDSGF